MMTHSRPNDRRILLFVKAPLLGRVKTRLSKVVGRHEAANLYKCFVSDTIAVLQQTDFAWRICYHPPQAANQMIEWLGPSFTYMPQHGNNLGARMADAFNTVFSEGIRSALIIGSDLPDLSTAIINEAFTSIETTASVIGPALDGGYYLIGFNNNSFLPAAFEDIPWGTEDVYAKTLNIFQNHKVGYHPLPVCRDIDDYQDLVDFWQRNRHQNSLACNTLTYLSQMDIRSK